MHVLTLQNCLVHFEFVCRNGLQMFAINQNWFQNLSYVDAHSAIFNFAENCIFLSLITKSILKTQIWMRACLQFCKIIVCKLPFLLILLNIGSSSLGAPSSDDSPSSLLPPTFLVAFSLVVVSLLPACVLLFVFSALVSFFCLGILF